MGLSRSLLVQHSCTAASIWSPVTEWPFLLQSHTHTCMYPYLQSTHKDKPTLAHSCQDNGLLILASDWTGPDYPEGTSCQGETRPSFLSIVTHVHTQTHTPMVMPLRSLILTKKQKEMFTNTTVARGYNWELPMFSLICWPVVTLKLKRSAAVIRGCLSLLSPNCKNRNGK